MMLDLPWEALSVMTGGLIACCTGFWTVLSAINRQFEAASRASEDRTVRLHQRIETLDASIRENYVPRTEHIADLRRVDAALEHLSGQVACAGAHARARRPKQQDMS